MNLLEDPVASARTFAVEHHGDQRYGVYPYEVHLAEVVSIAAPFGVEAQVVAWLHDVVEDTEVQEADIAALFGDAVARNVALLTDPPAPNRKARKAQLHARLATVTADGPLSLGLIVKVCDRLANVRACVRDSNRRLLAMYAGEQEHFWESAHRRGLCDEIWSELESLLG